MLTCTVFVLVLLLDLRRQKDLPTLRAKTEYSECLSSGQKGELDSVQRKRNGKNTCRDTHTCDLSDSVENLQFLWIKSTNIFVTVTVDERETCQMNHFLTHSTIGTLAL